MQDIERIIERQRAFFDKGVTFEYGFRMQALNRLGLALEEWEDDLKEALWQDLHKSPSESYMTEIGLCLSELKYVKRHLKGWMRPAYVLPSTGQLPACTYTLAEPYGISLIMAPWNYPVLLCIEPLISAIAAGNCVILKPSAYAPAVSAVLRDMLHSIFPSKYVTVLNGGRDVNQKLLEQKFDTIFFTGSVNVGKIVLEKAARHLTPVTLELGGKSPCIVDNTADIDMAAKRIVFGKLLNAGQTCVAPDYVLVHADVKEKLINALKEQLQMALGKEPLKNPDFPKIINEKHFERLKGLIRNEKIVTGGQTDDISGRIAPTILDDITIDSPVMKEEIFGPVLPVLTYRKPTELKEVIRHYGKPLAFYLFTNNRAMKEWVLKTFSFGGGCINDTIMHLAGSSLPFGGVGESGMGSYHGRNGFETFSHRKSIVEKSKWPDVILRYQPYTGWKDKLIRRLL